MSPQLPPPLPYLTCTNIRFSSKEHIWYSELKRATYLGSTRKSVQAQWTSAQALTHANTTVTTLSARSFMNCDDIMHSTHPSKGSTGREDTQDDDTRASARVRRHHRGWPGVKTYQVCTARGQCTTMKGCMQDRPPKWEVRAF
jgi:hypothetical protein